MIDTQAIRNKVLDLALQGKLTEQLSEDGTAEELFREIQRRKQVLEKAGKIKKSKSLPSILDEEKQIDIPGNWLFCKLGDLSSTVTDGEHQTPKRINTFQGYYLLSARNIRNGHIDLQDVDYVDKDEYERISQRCNPRKNDILISCSGSVGRCTVVADNNKYCMVRSVAVLSPILVESKYIMYSIQSTYVQNQIQNKAKQTLQANLFQDAIKNLVIMLPPINEQCRIVAQIESAFSILETIDTLQNQYHDNLTILKRKLIGAAIRGRLTNQLPEDGTAEELYQQIQREKQKLIREGKIKKEKPLQPVSEDETPFKIPKNWKWVRLNNLTSKITSGNTPTGGKKSNAYVDTGYCFFREQNIYDDGIHQGGMVYISEELLNSRSNSTVIAKDILLNITGGSIGRCAIIPDDFDRGSINQHILIIRMVEEAMRYYIHALLCSPYGQKYINSKSIGDKDGFSGGRCKNMPIPIPPLAEQKRIVSKLEELLPLCE